MINTSQYRIMPESCYSAENPFITYPNFTNNGIYWESHLEVFPYNIPFHPGQGSYIYYPNDLGYQRGDLGNEPGDKK